MNTISSFDVIDATILTAVAFVAGVIAVSASVAQEVVGDTLRVVAAPLARVARAVVCRM